MWSTMPHLLVLTWQHHSSMNQSLYNWCNNSSWITWIHVFYYGNCLREVNEKEKNYIAIICTETKQAGRNEWLCVLNSTSYMGVGIHPQTKVCVDPIWYTSNQRVYTQVLYSNVLSASDNHKFDQVILEKFIHLYQWLIIGTLVWPSLSKHLRYCLIS